MVPPLIGLQGRLTDPEVASILKSGRNLMPPMPNISNDEKKDLLDYLFRRNQPPSVNTSRYEAAVADNFTFGGYAYLLDQNGYPGIKPPWGLLTSYDLNTGKILWKVPLGEYPEPDAKGYTNYRNAKSWGRIGDGRKPGIRWGYAGPHAARIRCGYRQRALES